MAEDGLQSPFNKCCRSQRTKAPWSYHVCMICMFFEVMIGVWKYEQCSMKWGCSVTEPCLVFVYVMKEVPRNMPMSPITLLLLQVGGLGIQYFEKLQWAMLNLLSFNEAMTSPVVLPAKICSRALLLPVACLCKRCLQWNSILWGSPTWIPTCKSITPSGCGKYFHIVLSFYLTLFPRTYTFYPAFNL